nr:immunoglobulin heavy chain junction region [Macaca mulatta]MOV49599.1 immunoglobulin heavy chain junction region [Macaca mulatta]MOV49819.1 immunoglobulin heavy chain junction region [Macaca mulatta]MOV49840.1 immunoglobulin heavy chain junction region [Macaca mulatta]MOV50868.1 immunoglobulin heavy chain junction region [Macaca mulatta]
CGRDFWSDSREGVYW